MYNKNYLAHYGVKGMKWGVRKKDYQSMNAGFNSASQAARSAASVSDRVSGRKRRKTMQAIDTSKISDQELQKRINRLNMERNYKSLMTEDLSEGRSRVSSTLFILGDTLAIASSVAGIAVAVKQLKE